MICRNCGQTIKHSQHYTPTEHGTGYVHVSCPPKAERSGVLQGCLPSTNCSAEAGAEAHSDSLINSVVPPNKAIRRDNVTLLACPFCGETPELRYVAEGRIATVTCMSGDCGVSPFASGYHKDAAIYKWNTRRAGGEASDAPALAAQRERAIRRND